MKRVWLILAAMLGLAATAMPASADVQYTLNCSGNAADCGAGNNNFNFGTVTLSTPNGLTSVHVVVQLASGYRFSSTNNDDAFYWNAPTFALNNNQNITNLTSTFDSNGLQNNGVRNAGSYFNTGGFDYFVERDNSGGSPTSLSFDTTRTGGLTLADFAQGNDGGVFYFAAQIRTTASGSNLFWVASNKAGVRVPEPATMTLSIAALGGLMGLAILQRRRKLVRAA